MKKLAPPLRLVSGVVLAVYVAQHLLNHAAGLVSFAAAEWFRLHIAVVFQTVPGQLLLYASFFLHAALALHTLYRKGSLRMPAWQLAQLAMGLAVLPLLAGHVIGTRGLHQLGNIDPDYPLVAVTLLLYPIALVKLSVLLPIVWIHTAIGLHFWLRLKPRYNTYLPYLYAAALLVPALAIVGVFNMLREASDWLADKARIEEIFAPINALPSSVLKTLQEMESRVLVAMAVLLLVVLLARQLRLWLALRKGTFTVAHSNGQSLREQTGRSLLDALRHAGIAHAAVCGGRARCTTCRVRVGTGLSDLVAAGELEAQALQRIAAPPDVRLACQLYPHCDISITPLVDARQSAAAAVHAGGVHGHEERVVAMFVDMRGSTSMGERVLAYDVVFILNRFFTELSLALEETHGHYAQFAGDGLMALYGISSRRKDTACADALRGAAAMYRRLAQLNTQLEAEFGEQIKMGVGIHGGEAIVGTMGPPKTPLLTAVGDNINIAARLEAQTKTLGCDVIVSLETLRAENIECTAESVREVPVRGRNDDVTVCTLSKKELAALLQ